MWRVLAGVWLVLGACEPGAVSIDDHGGSSGNGGGENGGGGGGNGGGGGPGGNGGGGGQPGPQGAWCADGCDWPAVQPASFGDARFGPRGAMDAVMDGRNRVRVITTDPRQNVLEVMMYTEGPDGVSANRVSRLADTRSAQFFTDPHVRAAADGDGGVYVAFVDTHWRVAVPSGASWDVLARGEAPSQVFSVNPKNGVGVDADGEVHHFMQRQQGGQSSYDVWDGEEWSNEPNAPGFVRDVAFGADGTPWLITQQFSAGDTSVEGRIHVREGDGWSRRPVSGNTVIGASLAARAGDDPWVLVSRSGSTTLQVLRWSGSGWEADRVVQNASTSTVTLDLAVDPRGGLHVAYRDDTGGISYAFWDGEGWVDDPISVVEPQQLWMLVRANGQPVIVASERDPSSNQISRVHVFTGER